MIYDISEPRYSKVVGANIGGWKFPSKKRGEDVAAASETLLVKVRAVVREELGTDMVIQQADRFASEDWAEVGAEGLQSGICELSS